MALSILSLVLLLVGVVCAGVIAIHAFGRSLGTGVMVLFVPFYNLHYAFSQFEHPRKGWVVAGYFGCLGLGLYLLSLRLF